MSLPGLLFAVLGLPALAAPGGCEDADLDACAETGARLISEGRWSEAAPMLAGACEAGGANACYTLGSAYAQGAGPPRDLTTAASLFAMSCDLGDARACGDLGWMHAEGMGVAQDHAQGRTWMARACEAGQARSCGELALLLTDWREKSRFSRPRVALELRSVSSM